MFEVVIFLSPVDETCYGLSAGDVRIDLVVSNCEGVGNHNAYSGWNSDRQMIIMEVIAAVKGKLAKYLRIDLVYLGNSIIKRLQFTISCYSQKRSIFFLNKKAKQLFRIGGPYFIARDKFGLIHQEN